MAGLSESNPHHQKSSSSKKSGKSGKGKGKRVQFAEEQPSKCQRVQEDDYSEYRSGPLEAVTQAFENRVPYLNNGIYVDMEKFANLGYELSDYLEKYKNWVGLQQEYNVQVLRVFFESLTATVKVKDMSKKKSEITKVDFRATVRGRSIKFNWTKQNWNLPMGLVERRSRVCPTHRGCSSISTPES